MLEIRLIVRAAHILAAAAWVGGSILYLVAVLPALRTSGPAPAVAAQIAALFRRMVNVCIGVLLLTGAYLMFDRLTQTALGWPSTLDRVIYAGWQSVRRASPGPRRNSC